MNGLTRKTFHGIAIALFFALLALGAFAGESPKKGGKDAKAAKPAAAKAGPAAEQAEWQTRLTARVLEWAGQNNIDYGYSLAYFRDPNHPSSVIGPFNDGRGVSGDPSAYLTFPSQSPSNQGLRIFLDQMDAKNGSLEAVIEALEEQGDVKMLAEPTLTLKKGAQGTARSETRIPYESEQVAGVTVVSTTLFQQTGVVLTVAFNDVAKVKGETYAKLKVTADVSSLAGYVSVAVDKKGNPLKVPQTNSRSIENTVLVRDKTTLIVGILKEDAKSSNRQGPPILGDIPIIKHLFSNRSSLRKTHEILFLINVDLIPPGAA